MSKSDDPAAHDDDTAAFWATRLDGEPLEDNEQRALDVWLAHSRLRVGALLRAQAALAYLDRGRALGGAEEEEDAANDRENRRWQLNRRRLLGGGVALGTAVVAASVMLFGLRQTTFDTAVGEIRQLPLTDGSQATLNTASQFAVLMDDKRRTVDLSAGEAWFRVAHETARPFVVHAGTVRVRAVGTAFSVRRYADGVDVLVTEGTVEAWIEGQEASLRRVSVGSMASVSTDSATISVKEAPDAIERALAWRAGELALNGETLAYAVNEINRYNQRQLVIDDPALGKEKLVGYFRTGEPENFGHAVAAMLGARMVERDDAIHLVA